MRPLSLRKTSFSRLGLLHVFYISNASPLPPLVQSCCTSPYLEAESAYMANMQGLSQLKCKSVSNLSIKETRKHEDCIELDQESDRHESLIGGISNIMLAFSFF